MKKEYIKPSVKQLSMSDEICAPGLNGSGGSGEQLGKENAEFDNEPTSDLPKQTNVWDD